MIDLVFSEEAMGSLARFDRLDDEDDPEFMACLLGCARGDVAHLQRFLEPFMPSISQVYIVDDVNWSHRRVIVLSFTEQVRLFLSISLSPFTFRSFVGR